MAFELFGALLLNEKAIVSIRQQDYERATSFLKEAVAKWRSFLSNGDADDGENRHQHQQLHSPIHVQPVQTDSAAQSEAESYLSSFVLYDKVMSIQLFFEDERQTPFLPSLNDRNFFSSLLLYNLAVCFQLRALTTGNERNLERSSHLYSLVLRTIGGAGGVGIVNDATTRGAEPILWQQHRSQLLVELAALNNTGYTCYGLMNKHNTELCLEQMRQILENIDNEEEAEERTGTREWQQLQHHRQISGGLAREFHFFHLNVVHNQGQWFRPSPAA